MAGCAGSAEIPQEPSRLAEVNRSLEDVKATIVWHSGETLKSVDWVQLTPDSVRYRLHTQPGGPGRWEHPPSPRRDEKTRSRPIGEVKRIEAHVGGGGGWTGFLTGAAFPSVLTAASLVEAIREESGWALLGVYYFGGIGLAAGLVGAVIGELLDRDRVVVYRAPIDQYLKH